MRDIATLLDRFPLISDQVDKTELSVILSQLSAVLEQDVAGDAVEFGCYIGTTSLFLARLLRDTGRHLYVYDSFEGLPGKTEADRSPVGEQFKTGELAASKTQFIRQFKKAGLPLPVITKAWFNTITPERLPDAIAFAYLDGDYYESIRDSLQHVWPRLSAGAAVVIDDYANEALPGAARAVNEWLVSHPAKLRVESSLALLQLPQ